MHGIRAGFGTSKATLGLFVSLFRVGLIRVFDKAGDLFLLGAAKDVREVVGETSRFSFLFGVSLALLFLFDFLFLLLENAKITSFARAALEELIVVLTALLNSSVDN